MCRPFFAAAFLTVTLSACATTQFVSSWKNPEAAPLRVRGAKVAAVVMSREQAGRRVAEDALAREISARGAQGVAMYTLTTETDEARARTALEQAGVKAVVTMRPYGREQRVTTTPVGYSAPYYGGFWGGYYAYGWGAPWAATEVRTDTVVNVETLVYSLEQNRLVWGGLSQTSNPAGVDRFVRELAGAAAAELRKQGLLDAATTP